MRPFFKTTLSTPLYNLLNSPDPIKSLIPLLSLGDTIYHLAALFSLASNHLWFGLLHFLVSLLSTLSLQLFPLKNKQRGHPATRNALIILNFLHSAVDVWFFGTLDFENPLPTQMLSLVIKLSLEQLWRYFILDILNVGIAIKAFYLIMCVKLISFIKTFEWLDLIIRGKFSYTVLLIIVPMVLNGLRTKSISPILTKEDSKRYYTSREILYRTGSMATVASLVNKIGSTETLESPNLSLSRTRSVNVAQGGSSGRKKLAAQPIIESACDIMEESTYDTVDQRSGVKASSANYLPETLATIFESGHTSQLSPQLLEDLHINDRLRSLPEILPIPIGSMGEALIHDNVIPEKTMPFIIQNGATRSISNEELDWEHRIQAKILNELPEGVVVIDYLGRIRFLNSYMRNTFQCDEKVSFGHLSAKLCEFKFVETSIHINENNIKGISRSTGEDTLNIQYNDETSSDSRDEFLLKIQKITSLEQLFSFYVKEIESWEANQNCVPTFQTKFYHQLVTDWVPMEVKANLASESGDQKCLIILLRDTTGRDNKIFTLETEKIVYRNNLIASFSHELRTPLNANLAFLEQAIDSSDIASTVKQELIKPALTSGRLLSFLINDILDYSQLIVNCLQLKIKPYSLAQTINTALELFEEKMSQKNLVVKVNIDKEIPKFFYTDHARLIQILINLLSNSIKFTMDGCISITLKRTPTDSVIVSVEDDGVGMEPEAQENLRLKLSEERLKDRVNGDSVGVGLGLFISNKLAQLLSPQNKQIKEKEGMYDNEGKAGISFWSERNQGSHFYIEIENRIPRIKKEIVKPSKKTHFGIEDEGRLNDALNGYSTRPFKNTFKLKKGVEEEPGSKVLIVDDEVFNILVIENFCKSMKVPTMKAFNGREAIEKLKDASKETKCPIKIIFMDVNMPVMDGYTASLAIEKMLKEEQIEDVIIIGVTAYVSRDMIEKCYKCGMTEVLNKPLSKGMVVDVLKRYGVV